MTTICFNIDQVFAVMGIVSFIAMGVLASWSFFDYLWNKNSR